MSLPPAAWTEWRQDVKRRIWEKVDVLVIIDRKEMAEGKGVKKKEVKLKGGMKVERKEMKVEGERSMGWLGGGQALIVEIRDAFQQLIKWKFESKQNRHFRWM